MNAAELRARADQINVVKRQESETTFDELMVQAQWYADRGDYWCPLKVESRSMPLKAHISSETRQKLLDRGFRLTHDRYCEYGRLSSDGIAWDYKPNFLQRIWETLT